MKPWRQFHQFSLFLLVDLVELSEPLFSQPGNHDPGMRSRENTRNEGLEINYHLVSLFLKIPGS